MRLAGIRNYIIGGMVGAALMYSASAFGEELSKVGHKVQGEYAVKVGDSILSEKSIAVDGVTYAPLRAIGEATGYNVVFQDKTVLFTLKHGEESSVENNTADKPVATEAPSSKTLTEGQQALLDMVDAQIQSVKDRMELAQKFADSTDPANAGFKQNVIDLQAKLEDLEKQKADLEAQMKQ